MGKITFKYFPEKSFVIEAGDDFPSVFNNNENGNLISGQIELFRYLYEKSNLIKFKHELEIILIEEIILHNRDFLFENLKHNIPKIFIGTLNISNQQYLSTSIHKKAINEIDNNIWLHYIKLEKENSFRKMFNSKLKLISKYYKHGYYDLIITREYLSIHRKIVKENKIDGYGGHSSQVLPFVFTSEANFREKTLNTIGEISKTINEKIGSDSDKKIKWRLLLIDDYADKKLRQLDDGRVSNLNKLSILESVLENISKECEKIAFEIDFASSLEDGEEKLRNEAYDIVLVDYLFSYKKGPNFGIQLLLDLKKDFISNEYKRGPFDNFWIIPISVFSTAFIDDMRNQGIDFASEFWELSRGADFINTPWLFLFYFSQFQLQQLKRATKLIGQHFNEQLITLLNYIEEKNVTNSKKYGLKKYQELILDFKDRTSLDNAESGFLKDIVTYLKEDDTTNNIKKIRHFHALLYYLGFKNYVNNEDLIIEYQILKSLTKNVRNSSF